MRVSEVKGKKKQNKRHNSHLFQPLCVFIRDDTVLAFLTFIQNKQKTRQQLLICVHTGSNVFPLVPCIRGLLSSDGDKGVRVCVCLAFCVDCSEDI